jgi:C-terminal processing protease CtpA/Prc
VSVAAERVKNGVGPDDFSPLVPVTLSPTEGLSIYEKPVLVLTNCRSFSATNFFATIMRGLDLTGRADVTLVGDRTGGGGGLPATTELTNGWELRVSTSQLFALDPVNPETIPSPIDALNVEGGVQPDVAVDAPSADLAAGTDAILDYALNFLRSL